MVFHVHLYNVGKKPDTAFNVIRAGIPIDKLYLLNNEDPIYLEVEKVIIDGFKPFSIEVSPARIDPFDYHNVFNTVLDLYRSECAIHDDVRFHINFTMGTSIVVGAVCSAAYSINADLYYIQEACYSKTNEDQLIQIEIQNIDEIAELRKRKQTLEVFRKFSDRGFKTNEDLMGSLKTPSSLSYHTKYLHQAGLIERRGSVRNTEWVLTEKGIQVLNRL